MATIDKRSESETRLSVVPLESHALLPRGLQPVPFPWEKLTGKPLIYASLGTLVNGLKNVHAAILKAVGEFPDMQAVLSLGKNFNPDDNKHMTNT